jgi:hypothetical protein
MLRCSSLAILTYCRVRSGRELRGASPDGRILGSAGSRSGPSRFMIYTRSMCFSPNKPSGRKSKNRSAST